MRYGEKDFGPNKNRKIGDFLKTVKDENKIQLQKLSGYEENLRKWIEEGKGLERNFPVPEHLVQIAKIGKPTLIDDNTKIHQSTRYKLNKAFTVFDMVGA